MSELVIESFNSVKKTYSWIIKTCCFFFCITSCQFIFIHIYFWHVKRAYKIMHICFTIMFINNAEWNKDHDHIFIPSVAVSVMEQLQWNHWFLFQIHKLLLYPLWEISLELVSLNWPFSASAYMPNLAGVLRGVLGSILPGVAISLL